MKKPSNSKMKSQELRSLANNLLIQIEEKNNRIAELQKQVDRYTRQDLVWFARHEVRGLYQEQTGVIDLNKIKADAVRSIINMEETDYWKVMDTYSVTVEDIMECADKIERGE